MNIKPKNKKFLKNEKNFKKRLDKTQFIGYNR